MNQFRVSFSRKASAVGAAALGLVGAAQAAVPEEVTTAISSMKDDGVAVAVAFLVAIIAVAAIKFLRSAK